MLSHFLHGDPKQVSRLLEQMEEDGLLARVGDPAKRNRVMITLMVKGEEGYERLSQANVARMAIFSCVTRKQRDDLEVYPDGLYRCALYLIRST
jgi:DNA-binding MarR family transcriptional regulator